MTTDGREDEPRIQEIRELAKALLTLLEHPELRHDRHRIRAAAQGLAPLIEQIVGESRGTTRPEIWPLHFAGVAEPDRGDGGGSAGW